MSAVDVRRPVADLAAAVQAGEVKAVDLAQACLDAAKKQHSYHALLELNADALADAKEIDRRVAAGEKLGPLAGVPFIAKDNFLTLAGHTTAASNILKPFKAPYQATAISLLLAAGAVLIGKANLDAFGHGGSTENSDFGPTKNPVDATRVPGGSSGGSAAAVALGLCSFSLGTDTGGSLRLPAAYCGVVGLKPTYGLVSRSGVVAMGSSLDVVGPVTNRVADAAAVLDVIAGQDPLDATTIERAAHPYTHYDLPMKGRRIGVIKEYLGKGVDPQVKQRVLDAAEVLKKAGATIAEVSLPAAELALAAYYIVTPAEISSNLARYDGVRFGYSSKHAKDLGETYLKSRDEGFGAEAKRRILIGTYVLSSGYYDAYYKRAQQVRTRLIEEFDAAFHKYDILLGPVASTPAFKLGSKDQDPLAMYAVDLATVAVNLVGASAISVPGKTVDKLPVGVQLIGPQRGEKVLLATAAALEEAQ